MGLKKFPQMTFTPDREAFLVNLCRDKVVLHLGCADALCFDEHTRIGRHLHALISSVSRKSYGVDVDKLALNRLHDRYSINNLYEGDVENLDLKFDEVFDIVIAGEIIEHLNNPGLFLNSIKHYINEDTSLLLTTPNLLSLKLFLHSIVKNQRIHYDHSLGFTFSLLETLLSRHNYYVAEWITTVECFSSRRNSLANLLFRGIFTMLPQYADTLIAIIRSGSRQSNGQI